MPKKKLVEADIERKHTPSRIETAVLLKSKRRCALCFQLHDDLAEKTGQIAHLDDDSANFAESNLAFLCLEHHTKYDSTTSQHKNYTESEVKASREKMYSILEQRALCSLSSSIHDPIATLRSRDFSSIVKALENIHWPSLDEHIAEMPYMLVKPMLYFSLSLDSIVNSSLFHINDPELRHELSELNRLLSESISYGDHYMITHSGDYVFANPDDRPFDSKEEADFSHVQRTIALLNTAKQRLLTTLRKNFPEIDLSDMNEKAWQAYQAHLNPKWLPGR